MAAVREDPEVRSGGFAVLELNLASAPSEVEFTVRFAEYASFLAKDGEKALKPSVFRAPLIDFVGAKARYSLGPNICYFIHDFDLIDIADPNGGFSTGEVEWPRMGLGDWCPGKPVPSRDQAKKAHHAREAVRRKRPATNQVLEEQNEEDESATSFAAPTVTSPPDLPTSRPRVEEIAPEPEETVAEEDLGGRAPAQVVARIEELAVEPEVAAPVEKSESTWTAGSQGPRLSEIVEQQSEEAPRPSAIELGHTTSTTGEATDAEAVAFQSSSTPSFSPAARVPIVFTLRGLLGIAFGISFFYLANYGFRYDSTLINLFLAYVLLDGFLALGFGFTTERTNKRTNLLLLEGIVDLAAAPIIAAVAYGRLYARADLVPPVAVWVPLVAAWAIASGALRLSCSLNLGRERGGTVTSGLLSFAFGLLLITAPIVRHFDITAYEFPMWFGVFVTAFGFSLLLVAYRSGRSDSERVPGDATQSEFAEQEARDDAEDFPPSAAKSGPKEETEIPAANDHADIATGSLGRAPSQGLLLAEVIEQQTEGAAPSSVVDPQTAPADTTDPSDAVDATARASWIWAVPALLFAAAMVWFFSRGSTPQFGDSPDAFEKAWNCIASKPCDYGSCIATFNRQSNDPQRIVEAKARALGNLGLKACGSGHAITAAPQSVTIDLKAESPFEQSQFEQANTCVASNPCNYARCLTIIGDSADDALKQEITKIGRAKCR